MTFNWTNIKKSVKEFWISPPSRRSTARLSRWRRRVRTVNRTLRRSGNPTQQTARSRSRW